MNKKQKKCLWIGIAVIVLMGLFPPVAKRGKILGGGDGRAYRIGSTYVKYEFILDTRAPVVLSNLITQWFVVSAIAAGLIYSFKDKKPKDEKDK